MKNTCTFQRSNGTQWFSLPSYYTAPVNQQDFRVQNPVPNYLTPEASVNYEYQSFNQDNQYMAQESLTIPQYGLTDHRPAYYYEKPGAYFSQVIIIIIIIIIIFFFFFLFFFFFTLNDLISHNLFQGLSENNSYQIHMTKVNGTQSEYARKDRRLEAFVDAICRGDLGRDLYSYNGDSRGHSQSKIRKQVRTHHLVPFINS